MGFRIVSETDLQNITNQARSDGYKVGNERGYSSGQSLGEFVKRAEFFVKVQKFHEQVCNILGINPSSMSIRHSDLIDDYLAHGIEMISIESQRIKNLEQAWEGLSRVDSINEYKLQKSTIVNLKNRISDLEKKLQMSEQQNSFLINQNRAFSKLIVELQNLADRATIQGKNPVK